VKDLKMSQVPQTTGTKPISQKQQQQKRTRKTKGKQVARLVRNTRKAGKQAVPEQLLNLLKPTEQDVYKMLAAQVHIGRRRAHVNVKRYIWKRRSDGVHIINLEKTWHKLILAARIIVTVKDLQSVAVMSSRTVGQRGAIKFAHYTGAKAMVGKWVPGTFTNPQNKAFCEPRLLIVDDPTTCFAALRETSYIGIPVIAFCGVHNDTRFVDCAIPCNNKGKLSLGLMFWLLAREVLQMRGDISRTTPWEASVDLFFYRDADEIEKQQQRKAQAAKVDVVEHVEQQEPSGYAQGQWDQEPPTHTLLDWGDQPQQTTTATTTNVIEEIYQQYEQQPYEQFDATQTFEQPQQQQQQQQQGLQYENW